MDQFCSRKIESQMADRVTIIFNIDLAAVVIHKLLMTVWNVWGFRNNINKGKNGLEYSRKNKNCAVQLIKCITRALQLFFQKHVILSMRITKELVCR